MNTTSTKSLIVLVSDTAEACALHRQQIQLWKRRGWAPVEHHAAIARVNRLTEEQVALLLADFEAHAERVRQARTKRAKANRQARLALLQALA